MGFRVLGDAYLGYLFLNIFIYIYIYICLYRYKQSSNVVTSTCVFCDGIGAPQGHWSDDTHKVLESILKML